VLNKDLPTNGIDKSKEINVILILFGGVVLMGIEGNEPLAWLANKKWLT
jgi:hypothetical protein